MTNGHRSYVGHGVTNQDRESIGKITDVLYDDGDVEPKWLVVKPGLLQSKRYVPVERSYESARGDIVVPFDKKRVQAAPKAGDPVMTTEVSHEATHHYDLGSDRTPRSTVSRVRLRGHPTQTRWRRDAG